MRKTLAFALLVALLVWAPPASAAWDSSPVTVSWRGTANGTASGSIDTATGTKSFFAVVCGSAGAVTISDSASAGGWTSLTAKVGQGTAQIFYKGGGATTSGTHTFTSACSGCYPACHAMAFSGADVSPFSTENGATNAATVTTISPGIITPNSAGDLVIVGEANYTMADTQTISDSFTKLELYYDGVNNYTGVAGWKLQTGAVTPSFSWATAFNNPAAVIATFKAGGGGGGPTGCKNGLLMSGAGCEVHP